MKILIIGSGGREHAIAWKLSKSKEVKQIFVAHGNAGTEWTKKCTNIDLETSDDLLQFALTKSIDLTVVGPETYLADGIVDKFKNKGLKIFGPSKEAAQLEGSKSFSKEFMRKYKVATAKYHVTENLEDGLNYIKTQNKFPVVIKADGLAAGKGVFIAQDMLQAEETLKAYMVEDTLKGAGKKVVIEEFLTGPEASIICAIDGSYVLPFISAKDHKQLFNGNIGPNTGGMGVICPNKYFTEEVFEDFKKNIMLKTIEGIKDLKFDYCGFIFFGIMITPEGCKLLEYNVRMGDPEAQSILPLMKSDLFELFQSCIDGNLEHYKIKWRKQHCVNVVIASKGYPGPVNYGEKIWMYNWVRKNVFVAGAKKNESGIVVTNGGRILSVFSRSYLKYFAKFKAYLIIKLFVKIKNIHYRTDIGSSN